MLSSSQGLLHGFVEVANLSGFDIRPTDVLHEPLAAPHHPARLRGGKQAVYEFSLAPPGRAVLKVGQVGPKSNARFQYQHYQLAEQLGQVASPAPGNMERAGHHQPGRGYGRRLAENPYDAIQVATAWLARADAIVTHDRRWTGRVTDPALVMLDSYLT